MKVTEQARGESGVEKLTGGTSALDMRDLRAIVVDDDAAARERLMQLLEQHADVTVVRQCDGGRRAVAAVRGLSPSLVFLNVEMPDLDGFGVISEIGTARMPLIIFTSAHSEYGARAFEVHALDYLLKPFDATRLAVAIDRAREMVPRTQRAFADGRVTGPLRQVASKLWQRWPDSVAIRSGHRYTVLPLADVDWIEADGNYAKVWVQKRVRIVTKTLATLEHEVLDPATFARVHRSAIVNVARVVSVETETHGDAILVLRDGTRVPWSRRYRNRLDGTTYFLG